MKSKQGKIAVLGLGYVGLPLALELAKKYNTIGFDLNNERINELERCNDRSGEVSSEKLKSVDIQYTSDPKQIKAANIFIISVPTPIDEQKIPNLTPLLSATKMVGKVLKKDDIIIYESTVYPGCTEERCVPVLEKESGLTYNKDFFCGYSPERINPGDKERTITKIKKITSGSNPQTAKIVNDLYQSIIPAGTFQASSIKVAEAAKVIENAQRDINIAYVNELAIMFDKMNVDTKEVLEAAGTKWNFLDFQPGLVGGHCIGVDPYYLTYQAKKLGYEPEIILAGRRINDGMGAYIANRVIKNMIKNSQTVKNAKVLVLGITFKENCPDIRNTKVIDIIKGMKDFGCEVDVWDPAADKHDVKNEYQIDLYSNTEELPEKFYNAVIIAVAHDEFITFDYKKISNEKTVIFDVKGIYSDNEVISL